MSAGPPLPVDLWDSLSPEARALILTLQAEAAELRAKVRALRQQVHDLQEPLNQNSTNSSRPPSTDLSSVKRRPPCPVSGRKPGGQPGHERRRPLLPPDHTNVLKPTQCRRCGQALAGHDPQPLRHQVLELPPLRPEVTAYQLHRLRCPGSGLSTWASLPAGVPTGGKDPVCKPSSP
jgi:transposase